MTTTTETYSVTFDRDPVPEGVRDGVVSTIVRHTRDHRGMLSSTCPKCHTLFAYWDEDDLDENDDLRCYCDEEDAR